MSDLVLDSLAESVFQPIGVVINLSSGFLAILPPHRNEKKKRTTHEKRRKQRHETKTHRNESKFLN